MAVCLVTGGAGFIGSHLTEALVAEGHAVRVLDNFSTGSAANLAAVRGRVEVIAGDLGEPDVVREAMRDVELVFHQAALHSVHQSVVDPLASHRACADAKLAGEHYCAAFSSVYGLETVRLRYFTVFGPRQRSGGPFAAVIPLFLE